MRCIAEARTPHPLQTNFKRGSMMSKKEIPPSPIPANPSTSSGSKATVGSGAVPGHPAERPQPQPVGPDPFNPESLRLGQDFHSSLGVKKALLSIPVRKPDKSWFVRAHPDPDYRLQTAVVELKEERETYLVSRHLWPELTTEATFRTKLLVTAVNRQGTLFLWEANLPRPDGRIDEWSRTALEAINRATSRWVRIAANMSLGAYDLFEAVGQLDDPHWPQTPFDELLKVAFKNRFIDNMDHPVLRLLRGEV
jgi:hypothetical protein